MRRFVFCLFLFSGIYGGLNTAFSNGNNLTFGAMGGINLSTLKVDFLQEKSSMAFGLNAGIFCRYHIQDRISIQLDAAYSRKGDDFQLVAGIYYAGEFYDSIVKINYLDLTPSMVYQIPTVRNDLKVFFLIGPCFAFFLNGEYENRSLMSENTASKYKNNEINSPDYGIMLALEADYDRYAFKVQYFLSGQNYHKEIEAKFRVISILFGYMF